MAGGEIRVAAFYVGAGNGGEAGRNRNQGAWGMGRVARRVATAAAILVAACSPAAAAEVDRVEKLIVEKTNHFRKEEGLGAVRPNSALDKAAGQFAAYMARTGRYGHEADGREPSQRAKAGGYDYCLISENISYQYSSADFATAELAARYVDGWKSSPGHRKNMREPHVLDIGVGVARGSKAGTYYAVQMFGRPRSEGVDFRIRNPGRDSVRYVLGAEKFTLPGGTERSHRLCHAEDLALEGGAKVRVARDERYDVVRQAGRFALKGAN
jgi:uncharacterized protein YkwD